MVKKKDDSGRFCVDYRCINAAIVHDALPLLRVDESLETLAFNKYFSTMDLMSEYWQVSLDEDARDKPAFCTHSGLSAVPATFQRLVECVPYGLRWKPLLLYL